jgi:hypothetical protein
MFQDTTPGLICKDWEEPQHRNINLLICYTVEVQTGYVLHMAVVLTCEEYVGTLMLICRLWEMQ